jgi:hypothetical protein
MKPEKALHRGGSLHYKDSGPTNINRDNEKLFCPLWTITMDIYAPVTESNSTDISYRKIRQAAPNNIDVCT